MAQIDVAQVAAESVSAVTSPQVEVAQANVEAASNVTYPQVEVTQVFVEVAFRPARYFLYACEFDPGAISNPDYMGVPALGDRAAWDSVAYASLHARDINEGTPLYHLPLPGTDGNIAVDNGTVWESQPAANITGGVALRTITADDSATLTDTVILVDASGGEVTVTLPAAATAVAGGGKKFYSIKKIDSSANQVVIEPQPGELVEGQADWAITTQYETYPVITDGTNWYIAW